MRCAIYCRVSSEEQKEGRTIDSQIKELEDFAKASNYDVVARYSDEGWSGAILQRPELDRLRDDTGKGLFEAVLVNDVDRLSREVLHLAVIRKDLEKKNVKLIFKKLPNNGDPINNFMINMLGSFAEFERELIADRTRRGKRYKVEARKIILGNIPPYGYRYIKKNKAKGIEGHYEINKQETKIVKMMFNWIIREGLSQREVVRKLTKLKIPTRLKKGEAWGRSTVHNILTNETYTGVTYFNKHKAVETENHKSQIQYRKQKKTGCRLRPKSEWIPILLSSSLKIINKKTFLAAQTQFQRNKAYASRNTKNFYLLQGLVKCGLCGAPFGGNPCHGRLFYRCGDRDKRFPEPRECKASMVSARKLEPLVWDSVVNAVQNPSIIIKQVERLKKEQTEQPLKTEERKKEIQKDLNQLEIEEERLFEAYRKEVIQIGQFEKEIGKLNNGKDQLNAELKELGKEEISTVPNREVIKSIKGFCRFIRGRLNQFSSEERRSFLRLLLERVIIVDEKVRIQGIIPISVGAQEKGFLRGYQLKSTPGHSIVPTLS